MYQIGLPENKKTIVSHDGLNKDIITAIHKSLPAATAEVKEFAKNFQSGSALETSRKIWNYLRKLKYVKDPQGFQFIKLPKKLIHSSGDCKSFSLLTASILQNLKMPVSFRYTSYDPADTTPSHVYVTTKDENNKEIIIDGVYTKFNKEVPYKYKKDYSMQIAVINGILQENRTGLVSTATGRPKKNYKEFNAEQLKSQFLNKALYRVKPGGFIYNLIQNELRRINRKPANIIYSPEQLQKYLQRLKNRKGLTNQNSWINKIMQNEINAIEQNRFTGIIKFAHNDKELAGIEEEIGKLNLKKIGKKLKKVSLKNILKGVKKIGLVVPRKAFLSLVFLNVRGLAKRLSKLSPVAIENLWVKKFGGKLSTIQKAISKGAKKRPLFGASKKVKQLKGIGYVVYSSDSTVIHGLGATITEGGTSSGSGAAAAAAATTAAATAAAANPAGAASVASIIAAAAPILLVIVKALKSAGIPEEAAPEGDRTEPTDFSDAKPDAETGTSNFEKYAAMATDIAEKVGIIPAKSNTPTEEAVNNALPQGDTDQAEDNAATGEDDDKGKNKMLLPLLAIGAAAGIYFLTKKKSKK